MKKLITFFYIVLITSKAMALELPITSFPLNNYNQTFENWIRPSDPDYETALLSANQQRQYLNIFYNHYYSTSDDALSPWSGKYVEKVIPKELPDFLDQFALADKGNLSDLDATTFYGSNFQPYSMRWLREVRKNINLDLLKSLNSFKYDPKNRAIITKNLLLRLLPTIDPVFKDPALPGEGYPFDNLQESAVWVGTPVYIVDRSIDGQWSLILTPHVMGWVLSDGVALTNDGFIKEWQTQAKEGMVAITRTNVGVFDKNKNHQFNAFIGTVFPYVKNSSNSETLSILIPFSEGLEHIAKINTVEISHEDAEVMPLKATPHNFLLIMKNLLGRPYGWGNMYFYNDCSAELQNLYTPFGVWLPRNSAAQAKIGNIEDKTNESPEGRIKYLMEKGKKFTTIVYIGGHVMVYIGSYINPQSVETEPFALTYQNIWGLKPADDSYRAVIGKSVLFPLLINYPEDIRLVSLANKKYFKLIYLGSNEASESLPQEEL
jgi:cell wall-associated NlpC family hydrolase